MVAMTKQDNNRALYLQVADQIGDEILRYTYTDGQRIPSVRETAARYEVNVNTVIRAYDYLSNAKVIINRRGVGYFVAERARVAVRMLRYKEMDEEGTLDWIFERLALLNVPEERLLNLYTSYLKKRKK